MKLKSSIIYEMETEIMKTILRIITNKIFVVGVIVIAELSILLAIVWNLSLNYATIYGILVVLSVLLIVYVINRNDNPYYRLAWTIIILAVPPIGAVSYLVFGGKQVPKKLREKISDAYPKDEYIHKNHQCLVDHLNEDAGQWSRLVNYIVNSSQYPIYENTKSTYLESGEVKFEHLQEELKKAEKFIFLEYFIIKDGLMWQTTLDILREKVKQGVEVRLIYDDWGCAMFTDLKAQCDEAGIEAVAFNPLVARLAIQMNNRDHRKIVVIDGRVGFVGGINLADEYINIGSKYGHWKDTAVMIEGEAVHSLTLMFLQFYRYYTDKVDNPNDYRYEFDDATLGHDFVLPFADAPTDSTDLGLGVHLSLISSARKYIYIQTPYLIVGYEVIEALKMAARSGVDVRIILPHVPDKKIVNQVTKSNYNELIKAGVRIFEYEPGFVHSKTMVVDDEICLVGTTNMDYRSYYLHFECSILFLDPKMVEACYKDSMDTIENKSIEITQEDCDKTPYLVNLFRSFANIFSGLM